ncbi:4Fe-4S binding protein [Desulfacinum hydrothermale]|nr:4Fe-4S binding protein [Desulfacinum hydrothermale]
MKREDAHRILYSLRFYHHTLSLEIDRTQCIHCDLCTVTCPHQAIWVEADEDGLEVHLDERRCVLCEVCAYVCPVEAISLRYDGEPKELLRGSGGLPPIPPKLHVAVDQCPHRCEIVAEETEHWCRQQRRLVENRLEECPKYCFRCVETCPRGVYQATPEGTAPDPRACLRCMHCLDTCQYGSIQVHPIFRGRVRLDAHKCPADCSLCIDICPVKVIERRDGHVTLLRDRCALCGACANICDQDAIQVIREDICLIQERECALWDRLKQSLLASAS